MLIAIVKEQKTGESRVAASPETVSKFVSLGFDVVVEKGAGLASSVTDEAFTAAGATIAKTAKDALSKADIVAKIWRPLTKQDPEKIDEVSLLKKGAHVVSLMDPYEAESYAADLAKSGVNAYALEWVPRITRAQTMDVLSSQSNLAGYKSVLDGAGVYGRAFPMMMTAAGTVPPAKVMVMGAGVAGLQAIATAKRLGAVVCATDVRLAAKEQVESLGGSFVMVDDEEARQAETAGGYAKEMSDAYKKKQAALIEETLVKQDIAITTALIPGRAAPVLITKEMVAKMRPGSVIVDMAAARGGNCELSKADKVVVTDNGVTILAYTNIPSRLASDSSRLFAKNIFNFISLLWDSENKKLAVNFDDEIIKASCLTQGGKVVHESYAKAKPSLKKTTPKKPAAKKATKKKAPAKKATAKKAVTKKSVAKKPATKKSTSKKTSKKA